MDTIHDILHSLINHFIPHEGNDYRPHLLQRGAMLGMLTLILISFLTTNVQALLWESSRWLVGAVLPAVIVDMTNRERQDLSLPTLQRNTVLDAAAQLKANDMAAGHYFSHNSPTGLTPWHWFDKAGYVYTYAGENLAVYFTDSSAVVDAWMKSPTHRANIVGPNYKEIGVGTATGTYNGYDTVFVVQLFGAPAIKPVVANNSAREVSALPSVPATVIVADNVKNTESTEAVNKQKTANNKIVAIDDTKNPLVAGEATTSEDDLVKNVPTVTAEAIKLTEATETAEKTDITTTTVDTSISSADEKAMLTNQNNAPDIVITDSNYVAVYSDLAATSTNLAPALLQNGNPLKISDISPVDVMATKPNTVLKFLYIIIGFIVSLSLILSVIIEWRQHRPVQTAYGVGLLLVMICLFYIHIVVTSGALVI